MLNANVGLKHCSVSDMTDIVNVCLSSSTMKLYCYCTHRGTECGYMSFWFENVLGKLHIDTYSQVHICHRSVAHENQDGD